MTLRKARRAKQIKKTEAIRQENRCFLPRRAKLEPIKDWSKGVESMVKRLESLINKTKERDLGK